MNGFINKTKIGSLARSSPVEKKNPTGKLGRKKVCVCVCVCVCWQVQEVIIGSSLRHRSKSGDLHCLIGFEIPDSPVAVCACLVFSLF